MNNQKLSLISTLIGLLLSSIFIGCASTQNPEIYQQKSSLEQNLNGKADIDGTIMAAQDINDLIYNRQFNTYPFSTEVRIEPGNLKIKTDPEGNFSYKRLDPGNYSIYFVDSNNKEKSTKLSVKPNSITNLIIYFQDKFKFNSPITSNSEKNGNLNPEYKNKDKGAYHPSTYPISSKVTTDPKDKIK